MPRSGKETRERILDTAESLVLSQGFAGTAIDQVIADAKITKGTFFYHFPNKVELGRALASRYYEKDHHLLTSLLEQSEAETDNPLEQLFRFIDRFKALADELVDPYPGCLFASLAYESNLFDEKTHSFSQKAFLAWREKISQKIWEVMEKYPPRLNVEPESLADMITCLFEGSVILSKVLIEPNAVSEQLKHFRNYLTMLFNYEA